MPSCGCVLLSGLLTLTLFHCSVESHHIPQERQEYVESSLVEGRSVQQGQTEQKTSGAMSAKHLLHDQLVRLENDVIETKRKRSFPGSNTPLDRLSISTMDPKSNKQRKVVELPRRRVSVRSTGLAWVVFPTAEDRYDFDHTPTNKGEFRR